MFVNFYDNTIWGNNLLKSAFFVDKNFDRIIIPMTLFLVAFFTYSYNLDQQPWHGDEVNYLGWAGNYIHLINQGDLNNPCLISIDNCNLLYHRPLHGITYSPLRMILIGYPMSLLNEDKGNFYNWSCYWFKCYDVHNAPTINEMASGRLLSPVFGALTITISFLIGKILFNRYVGIVFSLLFLFYNLWMWYSRTIMTEVHYIFFSMLTLLILLYSLKTNKHEIKYFILSAFSYGFAITSKVLAIEFFPSYVAVIIFMNLSKRRSDSKITRNQIIKVCFMILIFSTVAIASYFLTEPGFYKDPLGQIITTKKDMDNYNKDVWFIGYPTAQGIQPDRVLALIHYILVPSFIKYHVYEPYFNLTYNYSWFNPPTYSSVALTIFFFTGLVFSINHIRKKRKCIPEIIVLIWFASTFLFSLVMARDLSLERYHMPLLISILLIASYGFWCFVKGIQNNKLKYFFITFFIMAHSASALLFWQKIYFSPGTFWFNPLRFGTLQQSLENPTTLAINIAFVGSLIFITFHQLRKRIKNKV